MKKTGSVFTGIILIIIGAALILRQFDLFHFEYVRSYGLFLFGILFLLHGVSLSSAPRIYFSTVIALIGFYYVLDILNIVYAHRELNIAVYTIIFGLSFYPLFFFKGRRMNYLLTGNLIALIGLLFLFWHLEIINHYYLINIVDKYWPVAIILVGMIILISAFQHRENNSA